MEATLTFVFLVLPWMIGCAVIARFLYVIVADWWIDRKYARAARVARPKRLELRLLSYEEADAILRDPGMGSWRLAKEEHHNRMIGFVYLERLSKPMEKASSKRGG